MEWLNPVGIVDSPTSWNVVLKRTYTAEKVGIDLSRYRPLQPVSGTTSFKRFLIGAIAPNARPRWTLGAYLVLLVPITPDSFTEFDGLVEVYRTIVPLRYYKMVVPPIFEGKNFTWRIDFPAYHDQVYIEFFGLDEILESDVQADLREIKTSLARTERKIDTPGLAENMELSDAEDLADE